MGNSVLNVVGEKVDSGGLEMLFKNVGKIAAAVTVWYPVLLLVFMYIILEKTDWWELKIQEVHSILLC